jgi:hypothetical protein
VQKKAKRRRFREMLLGLVISSIKASSTSEIADEDGTQSIGRTILRSVFPEKHDHIDLATGEILRNPTYHRVHGTSAKGISAEVTIFKAKAEGVSRLGRMQYLRGISSAEQDDLDPSIYFAVELPAEAFADLAENLRHGIIPTSMTVEFLADIHDMNASIKYGWEPDGSGMIWNNQTEEGKQIPIRRVDFHYELLGEPDEDAEGEARATPLAVLQFLRDDLRGFQGQLNSIARDLRIIGIVAIGMAAYLIAKAWTN